MKIKQILSQHGNDFTALMACEHCDHETVLKDGYHDSFYHNHVIPTMICAKCKRNRDGQLESAAVLDEARARGVTPVHL